MFKKFSMTIAGIWGVYGVTLVSSLNSYSDTGFTAECVENLAMNLIVLIPTVVAHIGRARKGDVSKVFGIRK